jgi:hypothetical protein
VLNILTPPEPGSAYSLAATLTVLDPTDSERATARTALTNALTGNDPSTADNLVAALRSMSPFQSWLAWVADGV